MRWYHPHTHFTRTNRDLIRIVEKLVAENIVEIRILVKLSIMLVPGLHCSENYLGASATPDHISKQ